MGRKSGSRNQSAPSIRQHKQSGRAYVRINGKNHWLGIYGTPEAREKYQRALTEHWSAGGQLKRVAASPAGVNEVPIKLLAVEYMKHVKQYYRKAEEETGEVHCARVVIRRINSIYGSLPASDFGPLKYKAFRDAYIADGLARTTVNHYMWHIRKMFQLAGENELIPIACYRDLDAVSNLREGRSGARETDDVMPVDDEILQATIKELKPTFSDMVRLQLLTGMRPGEVRMLRPCDIDRSKAVWVYRPPRHKNQHKKSRKAKTRVIYLGPLAQEVLQPYLLRDHQLYCFCPIEASPNRAKGICYSKDTYLRAITRAALRVNPYPETIKADRLKRAEWRQKYCWSPNQLRHNAATLARKHGGLETAQQVLGHTQARTTEMNYAEIDSDRAVEFARKFG